jgi:outer membrane protein
VAELDWQAAAQTLMLRTAVRYLDLALAEEAVRVLKRQQDAVQRAATEAQDRFKLGSIPVTDTYEARARLAGLRAQVLDAETDLQLKRNLLADSTRLPPTELVTQLPAVSGRTVVSASTVGPLDPWLSQAQSGSGDFGSASNSGTIRMIGIQLSVPVFTGGYRGAKEAESLRLADKAAAKLERTRQQVAVEVSAKVRPCPPPEAACTLSCTLAVAPSTVLAVLWQASSEIEPTGARAVRHGTAMNGRKPRVSCVVCSVPHQQEMTTLPE